MSELPASFDRWRLNPSKYEDPGDEGPMQFVEWTRARPNLEYYGAPAMICRCDWCRQGISQGEPHATFVGFETLTMHRRCAIEWMDQ
jgi:hypothetical protein